MTYKAPESKHLPIFIYLFIYLALTVTRITVK